MQKTLRQNDFHSHQERRSADNEGKLTQIYQQYHERIYLYVKSYVKNKEEAEDITQNVFLKAIHVWSTLRKPEHMKTWLYRTAHHICIDLYRLQKRRGAHASLTECIFQQCIHPNQEDPQHSYLITESITASLNQLPTCDQELLLLVQAGYTYQEIGYLLHLSTANVATRLHRVRLLFRRFYQHDAQGAHWQTHNHISHTKMICSESKSMT